MPDQITDDALPSNGGGAPLDPSTTTDPSPEGVVNVKDVLSEVLGKNFDSDEAALKAVKDTFDYVGKAGQEKKAYQDEINRLRGTSSPDANDRIDQVNKKIQDLEFYNDNPDYKPYQNLINRFGSNPSEVVKSEEFRSLYDKIQEGEKVKSSKSVLQSNPRLGQVTDKIEKARQIVNKEGGASVAEFRQAKNNAVQAVLDAYEGQ